MTRMFIESLEDRRLLSVDLPLDGGPVDTEVVALVAPRVTAAAQVVKATGNYSCKATFGDLTGTMYLQIASQQGSTVQGSLYSMDWGGFNIRVTGTIDGKGTLVIKGSDKTFKLKKLSVQVASGAKTLTGTCSVVQMGLSDSAKVNFGKLSKAPPKATVAKAPSLVGPYRGTAKSDDSSKPDNIALSFTKQQGGKIWGKDEDGNPITGIVLKDGQFRLIVQGDDNHTIVWGKLQKNGTLRGGYEWSGTGESESGTFTLYRT